MQPDWHQRRNELREGLVFATYQGDLVKLDQPVPDDGTQWAVADWWGGWAYLDSVVEPGDLFGEPMNDPAETTA